jgi:prepilin peptidase CpaA
MRAVRSKDCDVMSLVVVQAALWVANLVVLAGCAVSDFRDRIIPNGAVIFIAVAALALSLASRPGSAWSSLLIAVALLGGLLVVAHYELIGAGDAKLIAAATLLVPPGRVGFLLIVIALAGGLLSAAYLAATHLRARMQTVPARATPLQSLRVAGDRGRLRRAPRPRLDADNTVPYGVAVVAGVFFHAASEGYRCWFATSCSL